MRLALIVTAALLVFGACSSGEPAAPQRTGTPELTATAGQPLATAARPTATPAAIVTATAGLDEPPAAIARTDTASVAMGLGSYCWTSASRGLCLDKVGITTGTAALEVGRGESVTIGGQIAQMEFSVGRARIRPVEGGPAYEGEGWLAWSPAAGDWPGEWSALELEAVDGGLRLTTALPAGRYLVSLSLGFSQGSAGYGLILDVR